MSGAVYVFGIVAADHPFQPPDPPGKPDPAPAGDDPAGERERDAGVRLVRAGALAAVVGPAPPRPRARRRDLLAHQRVLERVWRMGPVLPMRFGVVAPDGGRLRAELVRGARRHLDALAQVTGRAEVNVKVVPDEEVMVRLVAEQDPAVRQLRGRATRSYPDRLRLGEAVAAALRARAALDADRVLRALRPLAVRESAGPEVAGCALNVSLLVADDRLDAVLAEVARLDGDLDGRCRVHAFGPLPPYSFTVPAGG
ncbi:GvpL/GvpF family gas vesicle protein [Phytohabitans sp. ZYX-F-186]|uniref:GvpL/GvpF family gas vesicle protein n=1 Tax=Phytohabitans maris TaxID=3071409 RepID=A0ABU0ZVT3_9ACTN|nr:GvpL/GvpF family gas vesicle protein [Phytohabitans sp. ZYX-F-186]MDQ7910434.1 GvpL/GvpF family gas vesicle protein [Phytohabitans sp. ZYX-F-186]